MRFIQPTTGVRHCHGPFTNTDSAYFEDGGDGTYYVVIRHQVEGGLVEARPWNTT